MLHASDPSVATERFLQTHLKRREYSPAHVSQKALDNKGEFNGRNAQSDLLEGSRRMPFGRSLPAMRLAKEGVISLTHDVTHPSRLPPSCLLTDRAKESAAFVAKCRRCAPAECGDLCTVNNDVKLSGTRPPGKSTHRHTTPHVLLIFAQFAADKSHRLETAGGWAWRASVVQARGKSLPA